MKDKLRWKIYRFFRGLKYFPGTIKHWYQRARYGFSYQDCWGIDYYLAGIIPKMVKRMRDNLCGTPGSIYEKYGDEKGLEYWDNILGTIQNAFQIEQDILDDKIFDIIDPESRKKMQEMIDQKHDYLDGHLITSEELEVRTLGWKYFTEYFHNLWD